MKFVCAIVIAAVVAGCSRADGPVEIKTGSQGGGCALAAVGGVLVADEATGLAFRGEGRHTTAVFPDPAGDVIAAEGDTVLGGGAIGQDIVFVQCELRVIPSSAPSAT